MKTENNPWQVWVETLRRWGLHNLLAGILEAGEPLGVVAAQAVYISQPVLEWAVPRNHLKALARMLEDTAEIRSFAALLREDARS
jgi:hypothetical protein